jgi:large subunit ribosomal protein L13
METETVIIDATNGILGRIASFAAKEALKGKSVVVLNCANAIITGKRGTLISIYHRKRARGGSSLKGPFFPKHPHRLMKRTIRGMVPYKKERGRLALKRIKCLADTPKEYEQAKKISFSSSPKSKNITLEELSKEI